MNWARAEDEVERSLTAYHSLKIQERQTGDEPFILVPEMPEFETREPAPARSRAYDFGFVTRGGDYSLIWPIEAKVLVHDASLDKYLKDLNGKYLNCALAPYSHEGALIGYFKSGSPAVVFENLAKKIGRLLFGHPSFPDRNHRTSDHDRTVPKEEPYPRAFRCHHLVMELQLQ